LQAHRRGVLLFPDLDALGRETGDGADGGGRADDIGDEFTHRTATSGAICCSWVDSPAAALPLGPALERGLLLLAQPVVGPGARYGAVPHGHADLIQAFDNISCGEDARHPAFEDSIGGHAAVLREDEPELLRQD